MKQTGIKQHIQYPRAGWKEQIDHVIATDPHALDADPELDDWDITSADGLDDLPWDGPTYEESQKQHAKIGRKLLV